MESIWSTGSLINEIEALFGEGGTLVPYEPDEPAGVVKMLAENGLLDPEQSPLRTKRALQGLSLLGSFR